MQDERTSANFESLIWLWSELKYPLLATLVLHFHKFRELLQKSCQNPRPRHEKKTFPCIKLSSFRTFQNQRRFSVGKPDAFGKDIYWYNIPIAQT